MPQIKAPPVDPIPQGKPMTQEGRVLRALKRAGSKGVFNYELSRISLQYTGRIYALRQDGHNILCEREQLPNGKISNTFRYTLIGE